MKTLWLGIILMATLSFRSSAADDGGKVLDATIEKLRQAPSLVIDFEMVQDSHRLTGTMEAAGDCFAIKTRDGAYETWFDGKTQWTWLESSDEVNITEPSAQELMETNPLFVIDSSAKNYNVSLKGETGSENILMLTPKNTKLTNVANAELNISKSTNFPVSLKVTLKDRQVIVFVFNRVTTGKKLSTQDFRYNDARHPNAQIIDLR